MAILSLHSLFYWSIGMLIVDVVSILLEKRNSLKEKQKFCHSFFRAKDSLLNKLIKKEIMYVYSLQL